MEKGYQLSHIVTLVQEGFKQLFDQFDFWFHAEISRVTLSKTTLYFDLVQIDAQGKILAKARGVIFESSLRTHFLQEVKLDHWERLKGSSMLFHGRIQFHPEYGMSIVIDQISSAYALGQLQQRQHGILQQLQTLGIDQNNKKTQLGIPPYTIAVISSPTSQGLKDFMTVIEQAGIALQIKPYYATIHGNEAASAVYDQLQNIYKDIKSGQQISLVAILRGGGGSSGIAWQDDLNIAKGICYMPIPVMIAIGHTSDQFLLDEICRFPCKTPTDGAYRIVEYYDAYQEKIQQYWKEIGYFIEGRTQDVKNIIEKLRSDICHASEMRTSKIQNDINQRWEHIQAFDPKHLTQKGFALVRYQDHYLSSSDLPKSGEKLLLTIYDMVIEVNVERVESKSGKPIVG